MFKVTPKIGASFAVSAAIFLGVGLVSASAADADGYQIVNDGTNTCMSSYGGGVDSVVALHACKDVTTQEWEIRSTHIDGNYFQYKNVNSGLCMSNDGSVGESAYQVLETCNGSDNQIYYLPDGSYVGGPSPMKVEDNTAYALTSYGEDNGPVMEWDYNGSGNQLWTPQNP